MVCGQGRAHVFNLAALRVRPGEDWRYNDQSLLLRLVLVKRLSQDLDDLLSLI